MNFSKTAGFLIAFLIVRVAGATDEGIQSITTWQSPPREILDVLYAPQLPWVWAAPTGEYLLLADPVLYPSLSELAAPMYKLAGIRVNPVLNYDHGRHGGTSPRLVQVEDGSVTTLDMPEDFEVLDIDFASDGEHFALVVNQLDHIGLWVGSPSGDLMEIEDVALNALMGDAVSWLPDQESLLALRIPERGPVPEPPVIPVGPNIAEGAGASARSTYEARDLLQTAYDDALFDYYCVSQPVIIDAGSGDVREIGSPACFYNVEFSPDGEYILAERLVGPWSHEVAWWRFPREIEVWNKNGGFVSTVASLPLADEVPAHGVPLGSRNVIWRATAPHELFWIEALDGGNPVAEVPYRDRLMRLCEPFDGDPEEVFLAEHRILPWQMAWGEQGGTLLLTQHERIRRWLYVWLLDVDLGTARVWYDRDQGDEYGNPGYPVMRQLVNGRYVMRQTGDAVYFTGNGATENGDRPFLDLRSLNSGETERLFRCSPDRFEFFQAFAGDESSFLLRSESHVDVPNYYLATLGDTIEAGFGEATRAVTLEPVTQFDDPTPQLRDIEEQIVHYQRDDGVQLSFHLYLPPGYQEGTQLPTVLEAYPLEYSSAATAGQVRGSQQRFMRIFSSSTLFFLLQGYAVMGRTSMPMLGDPETTYDTFVPQLVADAEAAVTKALEMGFADPERIGIIGHSHGALMVANLLAHTDLFAAGIARSGSYNKTNQPFGFQAERRSLFDARDVYIQVSPTFFADQVNEPVLIIHGEDDSNPGTRTFQSEVFYEAVRGSGGTTRLVLLPFEDHGYRARESVEHVLWEQLRWFNLYLRNPGYSRIES